MTKNVPSPGERGGKPRFPRLLQPFRGIRGLLILIIPLVLWEAVGSADDFSFPRPSTWFSAIRDMVNDGLLLPSAQRTLATFVISLIVATVLGVALGVVIGAIPTVDRALTPLMDFFRALPPPALVPAFGLLLGPTLTASVTIVAVAIIWPILLNTVIGMRRIPAVTLDMSRTLGLGRAERFFKVVLPSLAPQIMTGVRISLALSLVVTLFTDIIGTGRGLGRLLVEKQQFYEASSVWGLLIIIGCFGYLVLLGLGLFERRVFRRWPQEARPGL